MTGSPAVEVRDVVYAYPGSERAAIGAVTLDVRAGEVIAIAGESGSGKSTLARLIAGLLRPDAGSVRIEGIDLRGLRARDVAGRVGLVFQHPNHQLLASTVREELALGPRNLGVPAEPVAERVAAAARSFALEEVLDEHPYRLAMPVRRRLALAAVVAMDPPILVLDEPTAGLDAVEAASLGAVIRERGGVVIVVTHDLRFAGTVADRLVVLRAGRVSAAGPVQALLADAETLDAAGLEAPPLVRLASALGIEPGIATDAGTDRLVDAVRSRPRQHAADAPS